MEFLATIGTVAVRAAVLLFFLFCAGLVFWYLFNQPKKVAPATDAEAAVEATRSVACVPATTPGADD